MGDPVIMTGIYVPDLSLPQFYLGTHRPAWLWDGTMTVPLAVAALREARAAGMSLAA